MNRGVGQDMLTDAWGRAGHPSAGGEQLYCATLVFLGFNYSPFSLLLLLYFTPVIKPTGFAIFSDSPPLRELGGREQGVLCYLAGS